MWHVCALLAQERIRDRRQEAAAVALARRAAADEAGVRAGSRGQAHRTAIRAGARRRALAAVLRRVEVWAVALAAAARSMAARVEDRAEQRVV
jgi:hypothetical protein